MDTTIYNNINRLINTEISLDDLDKRIYPMGNLMFVYFGYKSMIKKGKIYLHQTETSKKKNVWHVSGEETYRAKYEPESDILLDDLKYEYIQAICSSGTNWYGGYSGRKEKILPETTIYDGSQKLCISCVAQLYKMGIKV